MWLLIRAFDDEKSTAWKIGDIVEVRDDTFIENNGWGKLEGLPRFYRVHIPGAVSSKIKNKLEQLDEFVNPETEYDISIVRTRLYQFRIDMLSTEDRDELQLTGTLRLTKQKALSGIRGNKGQLVELD